MITGNTFTGTTSVKVNNVTWSFHVNSPTQITATVPSSATSGTLTVTNAGGTTPGGTFSVLPKVTSFSPTSGAANSTVAVNGTGLGSATGITFGGVAGTVVSSTATQVKATVPAGAPVGPIDVTTPVDHFTTATSFKPLPRLTPLSTTPVQAGDELTLTGTNLLDPAIVKIGTLVVPADHYSATDATHLALTVPDGALTGTVALTTAGGATTASGSLKIRPTITDMTPAAGKTGTLVTITGKTLKGTSAVRFGTVSGSSLKVATSGTSLTVVVPSTASTNGVTVTNAGGTTDAGSFQVQPKVTSFSPTSGREGTLVTVNGTGLAGVDTVSFNGVAAAPVGTPTATKLTVRVPAGATTGKIHVDGADGADTSVANFTVTLGITDFSPAGGRVGDAVTITGVGFGTSNSVQFGSVTATTITARTPTSITAVVPAGAVTAPIKVKVGTSQATSAVAFVVASYDSLDVDNGIPGSVVRISGTGFDDGTTVDFVGSNGSPDAASVTLGDGGTFLDATVPADAVSGAITVHTPYGDLQTDVFRVPRILSLNPTSGAAGTPVTITGSDFTGATAVDFNGVDAGAEGTGFTVDSDTQITAHVPADATTGAVHVHTVDGTVAGPVFTITVS